MRPLHMLEGIGGPLIELIGVPVGIHASTAWDERQPHRSSVTSTMGTRVTTSASVSLKSVYKYVRPSMSTIPARSWGFPHMPSKLGMDSGSIRCFVNSYED